MTWEREIEGEDLQTVGDQFLQHGRKAQVAKTDREKYFSPFLYLSGQTECREELISAATGFVFWKHWHWEFQIWKFQITLCNKKCVANGNNSRINGLTLPSFLFISHWDLVIQWWDRKNAFNVHQVNFCIFVAWCWDPEWSSLLGPTLRFAQTV